MLVIVGGLLLSLICRLLWAFPIGYQVGSIVTAFVLALLGTATGETIRRVGKYKIEEGRYNGIVYENGSRGILSRRGHITTLTENNKNIRPWHLIDSIGNKNVIK